MTVSPCVAAVLAVIVVSTASTVTGRRRLASWLWLADPVGSQGKNFTLETESADDAVDFNCVRYTVDWLCVARLHFRVRVNFRAIHCN